MPSSDTAVWADRLIVEGVNFRGFGIIPRYAMRDPELSIQSKGIYAYFCSMCGGGASAFPSVDTIRAHLQMGVQAYYRYRKELVEQGYLRIEARKLPSGLFTQNLYILVSNPKKFAEREAGNDWKNEVYSKISHRGLKAAGYGVIPRAVMQDGRMDLKAKAVYAYFASYAGAGRAAFPGVARILGDLGIAKGTYLKAMGQLQALGYLQVSQQRTGARQSRFGNNLYCLNEFPEQGGDSGRSSEQGTNAENGTDGGSGTAANGPRDPARDTDRSGEGAKETKRGREAPGGPGQGSGKASLPDRGRDEILRFKNQQTVNQESDIQQTVFQQSENQHTINNISINNISKTKNLSISSAEAEQDGWIEEEKRDFEALLREALHLEELPLFSPSADTALAENLVRMMASACGGEGTVRIGGERLPKTRVRERFLSLNLSHLLYVMECVSRKRGEIRNIRAYYLTSLYHAPETMEAYYENQIKQDFAPERGGF